VVPRLKQFTVVGIFKAGHYEYDSGLALIHLDDAARLFRTEGPDGGAAAPGRRARGARRGGRPGQALGPQVLVRDWTRTNAAWYDAVQIEKRMMFIILTLIVAVAAFNLVSTLVMTVTDKRADIAILRTLGASPRSMMGIFVVQGATSGVIGTLGPAGLRAARGDEHRRDRAGHRAAAQRGLPAQQHLRDQPHAQRAAGGRHRADRPDLAGAGLPGHAVPELARQPRQPGRGAAL
jgi:hypothetical protein